MNTLTIKTERTDRHIVKSAHMSWSADSIYFKFPLSAEHLLTDRADPVVQSLIFVLMRKGGAIKIEGDLSKSLIDRMTMFSRLLSLLSPENYKEVSLIANEVEDDCRLDNNKMITAFSGGLDAAYTTYKYKMGLDSRFKYSVEKSVMILGADIPIKEKEMFDIAFSKAKLMTDDIDIELIPVETNYREFKHNWELEFGAVVSGILSFFSKEYFYGAASNANILDYQLPWGMNPVTDIYFANDTFRFISDGFEHTRTQRANFIKDWKAALANLKVCWRNKDKSKNCGVCEKCVRTKLNFMAVGVENLPFMPNNLTESEIKGIGFSKIYQLRLIKEIHDYNLRNKKMSGKWSNILETQIKIWTSNIKKKERILFFKKLLKKALRRK